MPTFKQRGFCFCVVVDQDSNMVIDFSNLDVLQREYVFNSTITYHLGTSNWSADYFVNTGGIGFILNVNNTDNVELFQRLHNVFLRDWTSSYATYV